MRSWEGRGRGQWVHREVKRGLRRKTQLDISERKKRGSSCKGKKGSETPRTTKKRAQVLPERREGKKGEWLSSAKRVKELKVHGKGEKSLIDFEKEKK